MIQILNEERKVINMQINNDSGKHNLWKIKLKCFLNARNARLRGYCIS